MKITLIVSGSIAAFKSAELLREFVKRGWKTHVVLTESAKEFITPLTMQTLSGNPVTLDLFDEVREAEINHIRLADEADVVVVAPATANILAKFAHGICDDAATTVLLATRARIVVAPAMNVNMWTNAVTQENVVRLKERGVCFVEPESGSLACGWEGAGRLASLHEILFAVEMAEKGQDLKEFRIVVTAGPTRERIDPMRYISNRSSGKMGYALARQAALRGAQVTLLSGPTAELPPPGVGVIKIDSASELHEALREVLGQRLFGRSRQCLIMSAAVADHRPEVVSTEKLKQSVKSPYSIPLVPNEDIIANISTRRAEIEAQSGADLRIVGFAAETGTKEDLTRRALEKLERKNLDLLVGNLIEKSVDKDETEVIIFQPGQAPLDIGLAGKLEVADKILDRAKSL